MKTETFKQNQDRYEHLEALYHRANEMKNAMPTMDSFLKWALIVNRILLWQCDVAKRVSNCVL